MTEATKKTLAWGRKRLAPEEDTIVGWGARCIFEEFTRGGQGVVWDRQDSFGPEGLFDAVLSPAIDGWFTSARRKFQSWDSGSDAVHREDLLFEHDGLFYRTVVEGGPQSSYGYLYVTALLSLHKEA